MFLMQRGTRDLIRVESLDDLCDPQSRDVRGRDQAGEEEQEPKSYSKDDLLFPSGESLPRCWMDAEYRLEEADNSRSGSAASY